MKVLLTGGTGMLGKSILRLAKTLAPDWEIDAPTRQELNLTDRASVRHFINSNHYDLVIHCAAKVGGIQANMDDQVGFMTENLLMNTHVIEEARLSGVEKLIFLGSSCMYPRNYRNPLVEDDILAAPLEPTNEGYAIAKIAGERLCRYISAQYGLSYKTFIPCNLFGPDDRYDLQHGHLMAAILMKIHKACENGDTTVDIWGDGLVRREFVYVDDIAKFILNYAPTLSNLPPCLNLGAGRDYTVNELYRIAADVIGFTGSFVYLLDKPVGMSYKLMDITNAKLHGWTADTQIHDGIRHAYLKFKENPRLG